MLFRDCVGDFFGGHFGFVGEVLGFLGRPPLGTLRRPRPIIWYNLPARKSDVQPSSLTIFILVSKTKSKQKHMKIKLFGHPVSPRALGTAAVEKRAIFYSG